MTDSPSVYLPELHPRLRELSRRGEDGAVEAVRKQAAKMGYSFKS